MEKLTPEQQKLLQLSLLDGKIRQLQQALALLEQQIAELQLTQLALEEVKGKQNVEIFTPLGSGIFVQAKLTEVKEVLLDVGSKVLCKRKPEEAAKTLKRKMEKILALYQRANQELKALLQEIAKLEQELNQLASSG